MKGKVLKASFEKMLTEGKLQVPPLDIRVATESGKGGNALIDVTWRGVTCRFAAELKRDAKPQTLQLALQQARKQALAVGLAHPMVIAPYLAEEKLDQLLREGVSAIDFCGNAAIEAPGQFYFWRSGNPNQFPDSEPLRSAYRGDSSLVARVLLLQPEFNAVGDILEAIKQRGGSLTMGTVSKVLKRLESDLVIERPSARTVRLIQPERLLDQLLDAYQPPRVESIWLGKVVLPDSDLRSRLEKIGSDLSVVRTGEASATEYTGYAGEPVTTCYCRVAPATLLGRLGAEAKETRSFPNLRLVETEDQGVYFDRRPGLTASPIQSWLEMVGGDKRQKESAEQIRELLLGSIRSGT